MTNPHDIDVSAFSRSRECWTCFAHSFANEAGKFGISCRTFTVPKFLNFISTHSSHVTNYGAQSGAQSSHNGAKNDQNGVQKSPLGTKRGITISKTTFGNISNSLDQTHSSLVSEAVATEQAHHSVVAAQGDQNSGHNGAKSDQNGVQMNPLGTKRDITISKTTFRNISNNLDQTHSSLVSEAVATEQAHQK